MAKLTGIQREELNKEYAKLKSEELEFLTEQFGISSYNSITTRYAETCRREGLEW